MTFAGLWDEWRDRASGETLKSRANGSKPKTICVVARRSRDPEVIGSLRDRDTDTCRRGDCSGPH
jgi:hypothetical protein